MDLTTEVARLIMTKQSDQAFGLIAASPEESLSPELLRLAVMAALEIGKIAEAKKYNAKLNELLKHDASHFFFSGLIGERENDLAAALKNFEIAFYINPAQHEPLKRALSLIKKLGLVHDYQRPLDIALTTGGYFFETGFNANTVNERALGGSESAIIAMARELALAGKRVGVFCNCDKPGLYDGVAYFSVHQFPIFHALNQYANVVALRLADGFLGNLNPKANHFFWLQDDPQTQLYKEFSPTNYRIGRYLVLSEFHKRRWQEKFSLRDDDFFVTKNGYDSKIFFSGDLKQNQIIFASRPERGLATVLQTLKLVREKIPEMKLVVCTYTQHKDFKDDPELKTYLTDLEAPGVVFKGSLSKTQLASELRGSLFLIHPNAQENIETSCIAAIEAQASGTPVIFRRGGALEETIAANETGIMIEENANAPELAARLAEAIVMALQNKTQYEKMCQAAAERAKKHYRWDIIAQEWLTTLFRTNP